MFVKRNIGCRYLKDCGYIYVSLLIPFIVLKFSLFQEKLVRSQLQAQLGSPENFKTNWAKRVIFKELMLTNSTTCHTNFHRTRNKCLQNKLFASSTETNMHLTWEGFVKSGTCWWGALTNIIPSSFSLSQSSLFWGGREEKLVIRWYISWTPGRFSLFHTLQRLLRLEIF